MFWFLLWLASPPSAADTITLASGTSLEAELVVYQYEGNCQLSVTGGDLAGTILVTPCQDIHSFTRSPPVPSVIAALDESVEPPVEPEEQAEVTEAPELEASVFTPIEEAPLISEEPLSVTPDGDEVSPPRQPVAIATLPPGFAPPGAFLQESEDEVVP
jgi:hypothetical protein